MNRIMMTGILLKDAYQAGAEVRMTVVDPYDHHAQPQEWVLRGEGATKETAAGLTRGVVVSGVLEPYEEYPGTSQAKLVYGVYDYRNLMPLFEAGRKLAAETGGATSTKPTPPRPAGGSIVVPANQASRRPPQPRAGTGA